MKRKHRPIPGTILFPSLAICVLAPCVAASAGGAGALDSPPAGYFLVARDDCGVPDKEPHLVYGLDYRIPETKVPLSRLAADDPLRTLSTTEYPGDTVVYRYEFLRPDAAYKIRIGYFQPDWDYQAFGITNKLLHDTMDLTAKTAPRREYDVPPESIVDGVLELRFGNLGGYPPIINLIELYSTNPGLLVEARFTDHGTVDGTVRDGSGRPVGGAAITAHDGHGSVLVSGTTSSEGRFRLVPPVDPSRVVHGLVVRAARGEARGHLWVPLAGSIDERVVQSPWKPRGWCGYGFVFQPYGGRWGPGSGMERLAYEAEVQKLLTPVWKDPQYWYMHTAPGLQEWSYHRWTWGGTRRECHENLKAWYLERRADLISKTQADREKYPHKYPTGKIPFVSMPGHGWFFHNPCEWGCDWLGVEIGENIVGTQAKLAFVRGAGRMYKVPTFTDVSQWFGGTSPLFYPGDTEFTTYAHDPEEIRKMIAHGGGVVRGGGHSSSMLARFWMAGWLGGMSMVMPEAFQGHAFTQDPKTAPGAAVPKNTRLELSPIGQRAKEFYRLTQRHKDRGVPYTPFALLLDQYAGFNAFPSGHKLFSWNTLPPTEGDRQIYEFLNTIFPQGMDYPPDGTDRTRLVRTPYGETFDVLLTTVTNDLLDFYPVVVCLGDHEFVPATIETLKRYLAIGGRLVITPPQAVALGPHYAELKKAGNIEIIPLSTPVQIDRKMRDLRDRYLPVSVTGDVEYVINRRARSWVIGLINNEGIRKKSVGPVQVDPTKTQHVTITLKRGRVQTAREWYLDQPLSPKDNCVALDVPPGEARIVELILPPPEASH